MPTLWGPTAKTRGPSLRASTTTEWLGNLAKGSEFKKAATGDALKAQNKAARWKILGDAVPSLFATSRVEVLKPLTTYPPCHYLPDDHFLALRRACVSFWEELARKAGRGLRQAADFYTALDKKHTEPQKQMVDLKAKAEVRELSLVNAQKRSTALTKQLSEALDRGTADMESGEALSKEREVLPAKLASLQAEKDHSESWASTGDVAWALAEGKGHAVQCRDFYKQKVGEAFTTIEDLLDECAMRQAGILTLRDLLDDPPQEGETIDKMVWDRARKNVGAGLGGIFFDKNEKNDWIKRELKGPAPSQDRLGPRAGGAFPPPAGGARVGLSSRSPGDWESIPSPPRSSPPPQQPQLARW